MIALQSNVIDVMRRTSGKSLRLSREQIQLFRLALMFLREQHGIDSREWRYAGTLWSSVRIVEIEREITDVIKLRGRLISIYGPPPTAPGRRDDSAA